MKKRVNVMMDEKTLSELDRIAETYSLSRSSAISLAVAKYIQQENLMDTFPEFVKMAKVEQAKQLAE